MKHLFVTVGAQMPFDRLIAAMDRWAASHPGCRVRAQIGASALAPRHISWARFVSPRELERAYDEADAIVGHAGTGTLLAALQRGRPIVVLPRRADLRETRNDHQLATAARFAELAGVRVAWSEGELPRAIERLEAAPLGPRLGREASGPLVRRIADFLARD